LCGAPDLAIGARPRLLFSQKPFDDLVETFAFLTEFRQPIAVLWAKCYCCPPFCGLQFVYNMYKLHTRELSLDTESEITQENSRLSKVQTARVSFETASA
jgi:hypothetical protein